MVAVVLPSVLSTLSTHQVVALAPLADREVICHRPGANSSAWTAGAAQRHTTRPRMRFMGTAPGTGVRIRYAVVSQPRLAPASRAALFVRTALEESPLAHPVGAGARPAGAGAAVLPHAEAVAATGVDVHFRVDLRPLQRQEKRHAVLHLADGIVRRMDEKEWRRLAGCAHGRRQAAVLEPEVARIRHDP